MSRNNNGQRSTENVNNTLIKIKQLESTCYIEDLENFEDDVNDIVRDLGNLSMRPINIGILGIGNGRFELEIIYKFYKKTKNKKKILNLFIYEYSQNVEREAIINDILNKISQNIYIEYIYYGDVKIEYIKNNRNIIPQNKLNIILSLQYQHNDFYNRENIDVNGRIKLNVIKKTQKFKEVYYSIMFESLPKVYIYKCTFDNKLLREFPLGLLYNFPDKHGFRFVILNNYLHIILHTIKTSKSQWEIEAVEKTKKYIKEKYNDFGEEKKIINNFFRSDRCRCTI